MNPTIQLIQLILRVERNEAAQHRPQMASGDDLVVEKPVFTPARKRNSRIKRGFNLSHPQQSCGCA